MNWGRQGDELRARHAHAAVAARTVAEAVVDVLGGAEIAEVAGPRAERLVDVARLLGDAEEVSDPDDPTATSSRTAPYFRAGRPPGSGRPSRMAQRS